MYCNIEEPLRFNEQLYALNEQTGRLVLSHIESDILNRYSFGWTEGAGRAQEFISCIINALPKPMNESINLLSAWVDNMAGVDLGVRSKWIKSQKLRENWVVCQDKELSIATKQIPISGENIITMDIFNKPYEGTILMCGDTPSPETFLRSPVRRSVSQLAARRKFSPSKEFMVWLERMDYLAVGYFTKEERGDIIFTVVSSNQIHLEGLYSRGILTR